ncbi:hypothetical protein C8Q80DRAFT_535853 [Daedaleopsis nitida]|nr:hypothetical protein C8Q80DRAFT_535853 [Daedaleopsis nitida]
MRGRVRWRPSCWSSRPYLYPPLVPGTRAHSHPQCSRHPHLRPAGVSYPLTSCTPAQSAKDNKPRPHVPPARDPFCRSTSCLPSSLNHTRASVERPRRLRPVAIPRPSRSKPALVSRTFRCASARDECADNKPPSTLAACGLRLSLRPGSGTRYQSSISARSDTRARRPCHCGGGRAPRGFDESTTLFSPPPRLPDVRRRYCYTNRLAKLKHISAHIRTLSQINLLGSGPVSSIPLAHPRRCNRDASHLREEWYAAQVRSSRPAYFLLANEALCIASIHCTQYLVW